MQEVSGSIPLTSTIVSRNEFYNSKLNCQNSRLNCKISVQVMTLSSRGLGHHPFTVSTGVRIPVGSPSFVALGFVVSVKLVFQSKSFKLPGVVVQLVRIPACHAGGRGFESRPLRQKAKTHLRVRFSLVLSKLRSMPKIAVPASPANNLSTNPNRLVSGQNGFQPVAPHVLVSRQD